MPLFDPRPRADPSPIGARETPFAFYDRVSGPMWDKTRELLNAWIDEIDTAQSARVISALKKVKTESQFQEAFWEVYLHHSAIGMGFRAEFELVIFQEGSVEGQTPDLRISKGDEIYYVEATVVNDPRDETMEADSRRLLKEEINKRLKNPNFMIFWSISRHGSINEIRVTELVRKLDEWLTSLDVEEVSRGWRTQGFPQSQFTRGSWEISFDAIPLEPPDRGTPMNEIIGMGSFGFGGDLASRDPNFIRDSIKAKGRKYSGLDYPLFVAVLVARLGADARDVKRALFGGAAIDSNIARTGQIVGPYPDSSIDGVWATRSGPAYQHISAVITIETHLEPAGADSITPTVWLNPWALADVQGVLQWPTMVLNPYTGEVEFEGAG